MAKQPKNLDDLFHDTLKDIYFAEKKIRRPCRRWRRPHRTGAQAAFEKHDAETKEQIDRLERSSR